MSRRRYLMAYDIANAARLRRICTIVEAHGERLQYSVFVCDLSAAEVVELENGVTTIMNLNEDSVIRIDLGPLGSSAPVHCLGRPRNLPSHEAKII